MEKYLIINADDFGYNEQQNAAIEELLKNQLITSNLGFNGCAERKTGG